MSTITTRAGKGSPLTNAELDANFSNLNNDKFEKSGGTVTGPITASMTSWAKVTLDTTGTTAKARQGSDYNGLNFTTNALYNAGWLEDDSTKKKFAYIQHLTNGRHEFRTSVSGTGVSWVTGLYSDETGAGVTGTLSATTDVRAPIFYDSDNTAYYVNPNGTSNIGNLLVNPNNTALNAGWTGVTHGAEIRTTQDVSTNLLLSTQLGDVGVASAISIDFACVDGNSVLGANPQVRIGYTAAYNPLVNSSPDNEAQGWFRVATRTAAAAGTLVDQLIVDPYGNTKFTTSAQAPIFYDSDNTGYYVNPNGDSRFAGSITISQNNATGGGIVFADDGDIVDLNDAYLGLRFTYGVRVYSGARSGSIQHTLHSDGNAYFGASARAPIFYDSNNTGYYVDPASTSNFAGLTLNGVNMATRSIQKRRTRIHASDGTSMDTTLLGQLETGFNYGTSSGVTGPYLTFGGLGGDADYQGQINANYSDGSVWKVRVRNDDAQSWGSWRNLLLEDVWVNNKHFGSDGNIYSNASMRAPIFYDQNNTGYYCDPSSTSNLNGLSIQGGNAYGAMYFHSNRNTDSSSPPLQAYSTNGSGAIMSFHRAGYYAINMGLDSDNIFRLGGWSAGASRFAVNMSGQLYGANYGWLHDHFQVNCNCNCQCSC